MVSIVYECDKLMASVSCETVDWSAILDTTVETDCTEKEKVECEVSERVVVEAADDDSLKGGDDSRLLVGWAR